MEILHEAPQQSAFVSLAEHQAQTPQSFYSGPPVLHHRSPNARLVITSAEARGNPALSKLVGITPADEAATDGDAANLVINDVDIWVTSEKFILFRPAVSSGVSIPYPSISLHAIQRLDDPDGSAQQLQGLYMQLVTSDGFDDHDPEGSIALTLIPSGPSASSEPAPSSDAETGSATNASPIQDLFSAVSACANLHPDPVSPSSSVADEGEGAQQPVLDYEAVEGLPPPVPGSGGWITAENMHQFFDEEGNWRGGGLGPGAGMVREREEDNGANVNGDGDGETTDGTDGETKWRRTS